MSKHAGILSCVALAAALLAMAFFRLSHPTIMSWGLWDAPIVYDGVWRVHQGLSVHADFPSPLGPVTFFAGDIGLRLFPGIDPFDAVDRGLFIFVAGLIVLGTLALYSVSPLIAAMSAILALLFLGGRALSTPGMGYLGVYNLIGYAGLFYILADFYLRAARERSASFRAAILQSAALGFIGATLAFTKITFGAAAAFVALLSLAGEPRRRERAVGYLAGGAMGCVVWLSFCDFDVVSLIRDMLLSASARGDDGVLNAEWLGFVGRGSALEILSLFLVAAVHFAICRQARIFALAAVFALVGFALCLTIMQPPEFILSWFFALLCLAHYVETDAFRPPFARSKATIAALSIVLSFAYTMSLTSRAYFFTSPTLTARKTMTTHNDTPELMRALGEHDRSKSIVVFNVNIASFLTLSRSAVGAPLYWHKGVTHPADLSSNDLFKPEAVLGDADVVAIPFTMPHSTNAWGYYRPYLEENFAITYQSPAWLIYSR